MPLQTLPASTATGTDYSTITGTETDTTTVSPRTTNSVDASGCKAEAALLATIGDLSAAFCGGSVNRSAKWEQALTCGQTLSTVTVTEFSYLTETETTGPTVTDTHLVTCPTAF